MADLFGKLENKIYLGIICAAAIVMIIGIGLAFGYVGTNATLSKNGMYTWMVTMFLLFIFGSLFAANVGKNALEGPFRY